jgi:hypothetical protein
VKCPHCSAIVPAKAAEAGSPGGPFADFRPVPPASDTFNPYASPSPLPEGDVGAPPAGSPQAITPGIRLAMAQTRPWVLFLSVFAFVAGGLMGLAAVGMLIAAMAVQQMFMWIPGLIYFFGAAFYWACAVYLFLYSQRIASFVQTTLARDLEAALVAQKSFWKLVGAMAALGLGLGLVMMVIGIIGMAMG